MTDFGFKRLFGTEQYKSILIRFLNVLFGKEGIVVDDVAFKDKEVLPSDNDGKRIIYDVYCTTPKQKEHFILEMQQVYHVHFEKRVMYYIAKGVANQGQKGSQHDYSPVYGIFFVDFNFEHLSKRLLHDFQMMEAETHIVFSNLMRLILVCLKETKSRWEDCVTELEKTTFLIKNMHLMDKDSKAYKCGEYQDMFDAAEVNSLAKEDIVVYSKSKRSYDDRVLYYNAAFSEGLDAGIEKGIEKGKRIERLENAKKMLEAGIDPALIEQIMGISPFEC
ncbi:MAG: Rpn family recombination-promoting nuclease/putative transposase [Clostridium sp.]|nr:Rpn family recombination-promoting nuclease/putative transposase [Clostridium sp.]